MRFNRLALALSFALVGCVGSFDGSSSTERVVTGKIVTSTYQLNNPVVVAESSDHHVYVTHLMKDGSFRLQIPTGVAYRITLANSTRSSTGYTSVARMNWPLESGPARWAKIGSGDTLDLGHVYQRGTTQFGIQCSGCSGGGYDSDKGSDCHQDDHSYCNKGSSENDCDSDHKYDSNDACDKDDDSDKDEHDCNNDDKNKSAGDVDDGGYDNKDDGDDDDDHGSCDCNGADAGASSGGSSSGCSGSGGSGGGYGGGSGGGYGGGSGSSGGTIGASCQMNADCAVGMDCIANYCIPVK